MTLLSSRMSDYPTITQGKTRIPGINDGEEFELTDVSQMKFAYEKVFQHVYIKHEILSVPLELTTMM